jgi:hypothetical protein
VGDESASVSATSVVLVTDGLDSKHWQDIEAGRVNVTAALFVDL